MKGRKDMDYFTHLRKMDGVRAMDGAGQVADSMEVRKALLARMHAGELTLDQVKSELAKIKREANKSGKITRSQAYRDS